MTRESLVTGMVCALLAGVIFQAEIKRYVQEWAPPTCPRLANDAASCSKLTIITSLTGAWEEPDYKITFVRIDNVVIMVGSFVGSDKAKTLDRLKTTRFEIPTWASPDKKMIYKNHMLSTFAHCTSGVCEVLVRPQVHDDVLTMQVFWPTFPDDPPHKDRYAPLSVGSFTLAYIADDSPIIPTNSK